MNCAANLGARHNPTRHRRAADSFGFNLSDVRPASDTFKGLNWDISYSGNLTRADP